MENPRALFSEKAKVLSQHLVLYDDLCEEALAVRSEKLWSPRPTVFPKGPRTQTMGF